VLTRGRPFGLVRGPLTTRQTVSDAGQNRSDILRKDRRLALPDVGSSTRWRGIPTRQPCGAESVSRIKQGRESIQIIFYPALGESLEQTQQRLPQVLKPETEYATFAYVGHAERPHSFFIQKSLPRSWSYRKQGLHGPEMDARRWGKRAQQCRPPSDQKSDRYPSNHEVREGATKRRRSGQERVATFHPFVYTFVI